MDLTGVRISSGLRLYHDKIHYGFRCGDRKHYLTRQNQFCLSIGEQNAFCRQNEFCVETECILSQHTQRIEFCCDGNDYVLTKWFPSLTINSIKTECILLDKIKLCQHRIHSALTEWVLLRLKWLCPHRLHSVFTELILFTENRLDRICSVSTESILFRQTGPIKYCEL